VLRNSAGRSRHEITLGLAGIDVSFRIGGCDEAMMK
jgi:hypothetical protein